MGALGNTTEKYETETAACIQLRQVVKLEIDKE